MSYTNHELAWRDGSRGRTCISNVTKARRAQLLRRFEEKGYPLGFIRRLNAGMSLEDALDSYDG